MLIDGNVGEPTTHTDYRRPESEYEYEKENTITMGLETQLNSNHMAATKPTADKLFVSSKSAILPSILISESILHRLTTNLMARTQTIIITAIICGGNGTTKRRSDGRPYRALLVR